MNAVEIQTRVKKLFVPLSVGFLCVSFTHKLSDPVTVNLTAAAAAVSTISPAKYNASAIYERMDLESKGLSQETFSTTLKGYEHLLQDERLPKKGIITICDFSKSSAKKRLFIIDLDNEELLVNTYVAHGRNSGGEFATRFSNTPESLQSSLGFFVTGKTYTGKHGLSLKLNGVDGNFNDNAYERTIVIHGAAYVDESRVKSGGYMGRSWGCPAVSQKESGKIIQLIKDGTCLFIYYPAKNYLAGSKILNG